MAYIPPQKIGFYFTKTLPAQLEAGDDFSFYYIKEKENADTPQEFTNINVYLGISDNSITDELGSKFIKINNPVPYFINDVKFDSDNFKFNLGIGDVVSYNNNLKLNGLQLNDNYFINTNLNNSYINGYFTLPQYRNIFQNTHNSTLINVNSYSTSFDEDSTSNIENSLLTNLVNFKLPNLVENSILQNIYDWKGHNIQTIKNSIFYGDIVIPDNLTDIENYITIKNLGYGNLTNFKFYGNVTLGDNLKVSNNPTDMLVIDEQNPNTIKKFPISVMKEAILDDSYNTSNKFRRIHKKRLNISSLQDVYEEDIDIVSNNSEMINKITGTYGIYHLAYNKDEDEYFNSIITGRKISHSTNSIIYGDGVGKNDGSIIFGKNIGNWQQNPNNNKIKNSFIFGKSNFTNTHLDTNLNYVFGSLNFNRIQNNLIDDISLNYVFGDGNFNSIVEPHSNTEFREIKNNYVFGERNLRNGGKGNIVFGSNNLNQTIINGRLNERHVDNIVFGNANTESRFTNSFNCSLSNVIAFGNNWNRISNTSKYDLSTGWHKGGDLIIIGNVQESPNNYKPLIVGNTRTNKVWFESSIYFNVNKISNTSYNQLYNKVLTIGNDGSIGYEPINFIKKESSQAQIVNVNDAKLRLTNIPEGNTNYRHTYKKVVVDSNGDLKSLNDVDILINLPENINQNNSLSYNVNTSFYNIPFQNNFNSLNNIFKFIMNKISTETFTTLPMDQWEINKSRIEEIETNLRIRNDNNRIAVVNTVMNTDLVIPNKNDIDFHKTLNFVTRKTFSKTKNWIIYAELNQISRQHDKQKIEFGLCNIDSDDINLLDISPTVARHYGLYGYRIYNSQQQNLELHYAGSAGMYSNRMKMMISNINGIIYSSVINDRGNIISMSETPVLTTNNDYRFVYNHQTTKWLMRGDMNETSLKLKYLELDDDIVVDSTFLPYKTALEKFLTKKTEQNKLPIRPQEDIITLINRQENNVVKIENSDLYRTNNIRIFSYDTTSSLFYNLNLPIDKDWEVIFKMNSIQNTFHYSHISSVEFGFTEKQQLDVISSPTLASFTNKNSASGIIGPINLNNKFQNGIVKYNKIGKFLYIKVESTAVTEDFYGIVELDNITSNLNFIVSNGSINSGNTINFGVISYTILD